MAAPTQETTNSRTAAERPGDGYAPPATGARQGERRSGKALASVILGALSIPAAFVPIFGVILGILAITFASLGKSEIRRDGLANMGQATAGLVLGIIGLVLAVILWVIGAIIVESS